jgi:hypothetical protein
MKTRGGRKISEYLLNRLNLKYARTRFKRHKIKVYHVLKIPIPKEMSRIFILTSNTKPRMAIEIPSIKLIWLLRTYDLVSVDLSL